MINYVFQAEKGGKYCIIEQSTEQVILTGLDHETAKAKKRFLNFGGGFAGFTPAFILERIIK